MFTGPGSKTDADAPPPPPPHQIYGFDIGRPKKYRKYIYILVRYMFMYSGLIYFKLNQRENMWPRIKTNLNLPYVKVDKNSHAKTFFLFNLFGVNFRKVEEEAHIISEFWLPNLN